MAKKRRNKFKTEDNQNESFLTDIAELDSQDNEQASVEEAPEKVEVTSEVSTSEVKEVQKEEESLPEESLSQPSSIGSYLKSKREELGLNLKTISQQTKISTTNLEYLEDERLNDLPDKAYVSGYVKNYSKILGLNQEECLGLLEIAYDKITPIKKFSLDSLETSPVADPIDKDLIIKLISAIVALVILVGIGFYIFSNSDSNTDSAEKKQDNQDLSQKESEEDVVQTRVLTPESPLKEEMTPTADEIEEEAPKEEVKEEVKVVATPVPIKKETEKETEKEVKKTEKSRKFYRFSRPLFSFDSEMTEEKIDELIPQNFKRAIDPKKQNIFITTTTSNSWITYKSDQEDVKKFVLQKGKSVLIRGDEIRIFLGNIQGVHVFLNNKPLTIKSSTGIKSLVFPEESKNKFVMPLFIFHESGKAQPSDEWIKENPDLVKF